MRVKVMVLGNGPGPSERVVSLLTKSGESEEVILSTYDLDGERINVGTPLAFEDDHYLVELPREASSGKWRIWVPEAETDKRVYTEAAE